MLSHLYLKQFRSHEEIQFDFSKNVNVLLGNNGAGKTNILEAVLVLCLGKSYRASDQELIQYNFNDTKIEGIFLDKKRVIKLHKQFSGGLQKTLIFQGKNFKRMSFQYTLPVVLFEPDFMQIITRGPEVRREYFDTILARLYPEYQTILNHYRRTLTQRNSLLKAHHFTQDQIFVWNIKLSELAGQLVLYRQKLLSTINKQLSDVYSELANSSHKVSINYLSKVNVDDYINTMLRGLEKNIDTDRERGFTSYGPHRDDYEFIINLQLAAISASRGETRTILLALKILEAKLIEETRSQKPLLLLDDVFSELDEIRQAHLVEFFKDNQVIITTTSITPLIRGISGKIFEI